MADFRWNLEFIIHLTFFTLMGLVLTRSTPFSFGAKFVLPLLMVLYLAVNDQLIQWKELHVSSKCFLLFGFFLFLKSFIDGFLVSGVYWRFIDTNPLLGFVWIVELNQLWGFLLLLVFGSVLHSENYDHGTLLCFCFFCWALLVALIGGYGTYFSQEKFLTGGPLRVFSTWHTDSAKILNILLFPVLGGVTLVRTWSLKNFAFLGLCYGGIGAVYLTQSRAGIGSLIVGSLLFLGGYFYWNFNRITLTKMILLVGGVVVLLNLFPAGSQKALQEEISKTQEQKIVMESGRFQHIWPASLELIQERPIFGYPAGSFPVRVDEIYDPKVSSAARTHPHNVVLTVLYHSGIVGLILLCVSFLTMLCQSFLAFFRSRFSTPLYLGAFCAVTAVVLSHGLVDVVYYGWGGLLLAQFQLARAVDNEPGRSAL